MLTDAEQRQYLKILAMYARGLQEAIEEFLDHLEDNDFSLEDEDNEA